MISAARFQQIAEVFDAVVDATGAARSAVLDQLCGDDDALRSEVESLLAASPGATAQIEGAIGREADLVAEEAEPRGIDGRYMVLEKLGEGGMGVVYCARDRLTGQRVAIKRVLVTAPAGVVGASSSTVRSETRAAGAAALGAAPPLLALAREFRTLASIRHPHIISVLDYGFGPTREPFFTMELLADARPLLVAAEGQTTAQQVRLLLQVLEALTYVHRRGVLHRDLKPANVLVLGDGDDARVKVLDFGIACLREPARPSELAGTLDYMAPELFTGRAPSEAADLWAVAVMAHEILLSAHPIADRSPAGRATTLLGDGPIFSGDARLGPELSAVLLRALARAPGDRYPDAASFACELTRAAGLAPPSETAEIRESFLSAAAFVAREAELATLLGALDDARAGRGSIWLVGGASGVGKSRLLDELRTLGLVGGTRVTRGQAVSVGGAAYQVWQGALRPLCLDAELDDLDAGVLRAAVPDLAALLERPAPDPPELDPRSAQARFIVAVERLLLQRREPLVLLLEDLHWAEPASLAVLHQLARSVAQAPLLVIGSYRDDARPELPDELPGATPLALRRLSTEEMAKLSGSMLGEIGTSPAIVSLLERETEGNAFFVVEVVRALAEEAGALARVGEGRLPSRVTTGGVDAVLARRLGRVPDDARPLLTAAAVLGRELDLRVLAALAGDLGARLEPDLAACAAASILEVSEDRFRFAHDKLRAALLDQLAPDENAAWHFRAGEAIERAYADDLGPRSAALAHHFEQAREPLREARYRAHAGERATRGGAVADAVRHLERARVLFDRVESAKEDRARALGLLSRAYHAAGRPEEAIALLERMVADVGYPPPRSALALATNIARRAAAHALFRLWPAGQPRERDPGQIACSGELGATVLAVSEDVGFTRSPAQVISASLDFIALAERSGDPILTVPAYAGLGFMLSVSPLARSSDGYLRRARALLPGVPDARLDIRAYVDVVEAGVLIHRGAWEEALTRIGDELSLRRRMGDWRSELLAFTQGHCAELHRGNLAGALDYLRRMERLELRLDDACSFWGARCLQGQLALRRGALDQAACLFAEADEHLAKGRSRAGGAIAVDGAVALAARRRGDRGEARRRADAALDVLLTTPPMTYGLLESPPAVIEVHAALWSEAVKGADKSAIEARMEQGLSVFRRFAFVIPIARPRAFLWHGRWAALRGRTRLAEWHLRKALEAARRYRMPFEEALTHEALASFEEARGERLRAGEHRRGARALFEQLDAQWHLGGAREEPSGTSSSS
ncbi:MAG: AAA family ATPase [Byssovorax sp.]